MGKIDNTPYDDVFRTMVNDLPRLTLKFINEMFASTLPVKYSGDEKVEQLGNEHFLGQQDGVQEKRITDARIRVTGTDVRQYHMECQSTPDGSIVIRMFEYDSQIALQESEKTEQALTVNFPYSGVLFLRRAATTPDKLEIRINTPGGSVEYEVPAIKVGDYSVEDIVQKDLYFLIPFYLFKFEKLIQDNPVSVDIRMEKLRADYTRLRDYLDESCRDGKIDQYEMVTIRDMSKKVVDNLSKNADTVKEEVKGIMGGRVLDYEAKDILNRGRDEGRVEGRAEGRVEGRAEGRVEGRVEGMDSLSKLIAHLARQGKNEEILKVSEDPEYRDQMLKALNL